MRRIAVINGRIMHEGQSIEEFVIDRIAPEAVVVREVGVAPQM